MTRIRFRVYVLLSAVGCASDAPSYATPEGSVAGRVRDGLSFAPIQGAVAEIWTGDDVRSDEADADGRFVIDEVPAGSVLWLDVSADGYARMRSNATVDEVAGEEPQSNSVTILEVSLWLNTFEIRVYVENVVAVFAGEKGGVPGAPVYAQGMGLGYLMPDRLEGRTDEDGFATLSGVAYGQSYLVGVGELMIDGRRCFGEVATITHDAFQENRVDLDVACSGATSVTDFCDGSLGSCCDVDDLCGWAENGVCDCAGICDWDVVDCEG